MVVKKYTAEIARPLYADEDLGLDLDNTVYALDASTIDLKRLDLKADLYTILQILSLTLFEKTSLKQILMNGGSGIDKFAESNQLNLFDNLTGH